MKNVLDSVFSIAFLYAIWAKFVLLITTVAPVVTGILSMAYFSFRLLDVPDFRRIFRLKPLKGGMKDLAEVCDEE